MREREEEIRNIHKGMHQVNEIYKVRTSHVVSSCVVSFSKKITVIQYNNLITSCTITNTTNKQDLAILVDNQQEGIDQIETQMESAKDNTATGLKHIEKANEHQQSNCALQ